MSPSIYLAKLLGPALVAAGFSMLLNPAAYAAMVSDMLDDSALIYVVSVIGPIAGTALVLAHNVWVGDWPIIITLLGWMSIIDSLTWIVAMRAMQTLWAPLFEFPAFSLAGGIVVLLLGAVLCYFGYWAAKPVWREK
ncbi:MAG: hypothetical protein RO009_23980 [Pseudorhodoplanes sp.]|jgi:hypothetical protein|nr:hypothetical protein [Pseudorhodoplanes sp.]